MSGDRLPDRPHPAAAESDWLRPAQAAALLGVAQSTVRAWSDRGRLPAFYTPGGHRRYRRSDLVRLMGELDGETNGTNTSAS